jgi:hypothetical protein
VAVVVADKAVQIKTETQEDLVVEVADLIQLLIMVDLEDLVLLDKAILAALDVLLQNVEEVEVVLELLAVAEIFEDYAKMEATELHI